ADAAAVCARHLRVAHAVLEAAGRRRGLVVRVVGAGVVRHVAFAPDPALDLVVAVAGDIVDVVSGEGGIAGAAQGAHLFHVSLDLVVYGRVVNLAHAAGPRGMDVRRRRLPVRRL